MDRLPSNLSVEWLISSDTTAWVKRIQRERTAEVLADPEAFCAECGCDMEFPDVPLAPYCFSCRETEKAKAERDEYERDLYEAEERSAKSWARSHP